MSPLTALWVASVTGAALFFASGILSAEVVYRWLGVRQRLVPSAPSSAEALAGASPGQPAAPDDEQRWLVEISQAQVLAQSARREAEMVREQLEIELANRAVLDDELEHAHARAEEAIRRSSDNQRSASLVPGLRKQLEEIEQLQAVKARAAAQSEEKIRSLERELARSRDDTERLQAQLAELETVEAPPAPPRVQVEAKGVTHITRPSQSGTTRRVSESENTLEANLLQSLSSLILREPGLVAVLSDDNGFPVAGVGSDPLQESVSALTALAQELAFRVKDLIDLERIERLELADAAGRALRVRFFDWETHPLTLACLGKRSLVANPDEERVVSAFPKLLRRAWSA